MRNLTLALLAATTVLVAAPAQAVQIASGNATVANNFAATVNTTSNPNTFQASSGATFTVNATGGFAPANGLSGTMNGTLNFSNVVGTTLNQALSNFLVLNASSGGSFNFSVRSVQTTAYSVSQASSSITLYVLGSTLRTGFDATDTSLTLTFNSTNGSAYSSSATLAVPPTRGAVPEPASWAMMVGGFGLMGLGLRNQRRNVAVRFG